MICPTCHGNGYEGGNPGDNVRQCSTCDSTGEVPDPDPDPDPDGLSSEFGDGGNFARVEKRHKK